MSPRILALYGYTDTTLATGAAEAVEIWSTTVWREAVEEIYWSRFMKDNDQNAIIEVHTRLEKVPGERETFTLMRKLTGSGVTGDATLEGNEEAMDWFSDNVTLDQIRNAVRLGGAMAEKRPAFELANEAKNMLKIWMAEYIDDDIFTQFDSSPTRAIFGGDATSTATIDSTDTFTLSLIDRAVAQAKKADPRVWPVMIGGKPWYVVVLHVDTAYDLKQTTAWQTAQRDATPRDRMDNGIFSGALGFWGGAVIHEHVSVPISTTYGAGANVNGASNFFLGRQAGLFAWGRRPKGWHKRFDYDAKQGFAIGCIFDFTKAVFDSSDHGFTAIRTARTSN